MDLRRFEQCLDTYGADLDAWPAVDRGAGQQLLVTSDDARSALDRALALSRRLDELEDIEPSAAFLKKVAAIPEQYPRTTPKSTTSPEPKGVLRWWPFETVYKPALAMAAAAMMGVLAGSITAERGMAGESSGLAFQFADEENAWTEQEVEELSSLAFALHLDQSEWDEGEWP